MSEFKGFKKSDGTLIPCRDDSKQPTLTTQQLAAVNSGITSEKVAKIATIDERTANVSQIARDVEQIKAEAEASTDVWDITNACVTGGELPYIFEDWVYVYNNHISELSLNGGTATFTCYVSETENTEHTFTKSNGTWIFNS